MTELEQYIRAYARSIGLNEDVVMQTVLAEGGASSLVPGGYTRQSEVIGKGGVREPSFGPFQMYMAPGALGDRALKAGADPRNPADVFKVAKFALDTMKAEGLGAWHGWKGDPWAARMGAGTGQAVNMPAAPQGLQAAADTGPLRHVGGAGSGPANFSPYQLDPANAYGPGQATPPTPAAPATKPSPWGKLGDAIAGGLGGMGAVGNVPGAGGAGGIQMPAPAPLIPQPAMPMIAENPNDEIRRNALAAMMQKYWIS